MRCSQTLETSAPRLWAAGDPCEYDSVVHGRPAADRAFEVAAAQGAHAASAMLDRAARSTRSPTSGRTSADWCSLEYVGPAAQWDREVVRGSLDDGEFTIFYLDAGRLAAALTVGRSDDLEHAKRLIAAGEHLGDRADGLADLGHGPGRC